MFKKLRKIINDEWSSIWYSFQLKKIKERKLKDE